MRTMNTHPKLLFLVGPSGVGQTMLSDAVSKKFPKIRHVSLDTLVKNEDSDVYHNNGNRWEEFWTVAKGEIKKLETPTLNNGEIIFCDVGAGCYKTEEGRNYFSEKKNIILIWDHPQKIFERAKRTRAPWRNSSFDEFNRKECSTEKWGEITTNSYLKFDIDGKNEEDAKNEFMKFVKSNLLD